MIAATRSMNITERAATEQAARQKEIKEQDR
jgi:hypothetical protein